MNIILQMETHPMDIREVRKHLTFHTKAVLYKTLSKSKDYLFKNHKCVIVLYESRKLKHIKIQTDTKPTVANANCESIIFSMKFHPPEK